MPRYHFEQRSLDSGEVSPRIDARTDIKRYKSGLALLVNGIVRVQGGAERRPGTRFVQETKFSAKKSYLIPFEFSDVQAYMLEFGDLYVRFYANNGIVLDTTNFVVNGTFNTDIASWTNKSTGTGSIAWDAATRMNLAGGASGVGWAEQNVTITQANVRHRVLVSVFGGPITVQVGSATGLSDYLAPTVLQPGVAQQLLFTPTGTACFLQFKNAANATYQIDDAQLLRYAYEIVSPYTEADLASLTYTQSADTLFLDHPNYPPKKLVRSGATSWAFSDLALIDGPYLEENTDTTKTLTPSVSAVGASGTMTAVGHTPFQAGHVGSFWRLKVGANPYGYVLVTGFTSSTVVNITVKTLLGGTSATSIWQEGAWSAVRGYPRVVTLLEDRLWHGANTTKPQTFWASKTSDYVNHTPGATATDPINATISSNKVNVIRAFMPTDTLLVFTLGDEFAVASVGTGTIQPASIQVKVQTGHGHAPVSIPPVKIGNVVLFTQRSQRRVRKLEFDFNRNAYVSRDLSLLAEHLFRNYNITGMAFQREADQILWVVRADGALLGLTYDEIEDVVGWHRHFTDGSFERVGVIPHPNGDRDQVWTIVQRTINGATKRYVEVFEEELGYYQTFESDSSLQYVGTPISAVSGLSHLVGKTVVIAGDGAVHPPQVVDVNGTVSLEKAAAVIEVGLPYTTTIQSLRPDIPTGDGSSQARKRKWASLEIRVIDTLGGTLNDEVLSYRSSADLMGQAVPLFSGLVGKDGETGWDKDGFITFVQDQPLPAEVLGFYGVLSVEDS
jgi:hypothetical protein